MKVLIVGASGFLGKKIFTVLSKEFHVIGTTHSNRNNFIKLDITKKEDVAKVIKSIRPNIVIVPASITDADLCEIEREKAYQTNVISIKNITKVCKKINAKLIYFSTDYIFDGRKGKYKENDKPNPLSYYGKTKVEAENIVKNSGLDYIIARVSCLYGYNSREDKQTFVNFIINNLKQGKEVNIVSDQILNPTLIDDIAGTIKSLIKKQQKGIFHIVGKEPISRYNFALKIAEIFDLDKSLIKRIRTPELKQKAKRPLNASLNISKIKKIGIKMSNIEGGLKTMKRQLQ